MARSLIPALFLRHHHVSGWGAGREGQLEISFQWIFVLIAIGAFVIIFAVILRSCQNEGTRTVQTGALSSTAAFFKAVAWQTQATTNITATPAAVECMGGVLTLLPPDGTVQGGSAGLDAVPAFLPPTIGGRMTVVRRDIILPETTIESTPGLRLGNVLYGIDEKTYYYIIKDADGNWKRINDLLGPAPNVRYVESNGLTNIASPPSTASAVIIAEMSSDPPAAPDWKAFKDGMTGIPADIPLYAVSVGTTQPPSGLPTVTFYQENAAGSFQQTGSSSYATSYLAAGAIVAGRPSAFSCAQSSVIGRMRMITEIYELRMGNLSQSSLGAGCTPTLSDAASKLSAINANGQDNKYLSQLANGVQQSRVGGAGALFNDQETLYGYGCPVIG